MMEDDYDYCWVPAVATMDLMEDKGDGWPEFLIRKGQPVLIQFFLNKKQVLVCPDIGVSGGPFMVPLSECDCFQYTSAAMRVEEFH
jgi:hypothetical protein